MAKKSKKLSEVKVNFPELKAHIIPADILVPESREQYLPYKLSMQKTGNGVFQLEHRVNKLVALDNNIEVILLYVPSWASCNCTIYDPNSKMQNRNAICYSPDNREYSNKGFKCGNKDVCPLKREDSFRKRLAKEAHLLVRDADEPEKWYLCRYTSVLDNVLALVDIRKQIHAQMNSNYNAAGSQAIIELSVVKAEENGNPVCRFGKTAKITGILSDESYKELADYVKDIRNLIDSAHDKTIERNMETYSKRAKEAETTGVDLDTLVKDAVAKIKGSPLVSQMKEEEEKKEELVEDEKPVEEKKEKDTSVVEEANDPVDEDDDLPF